MLGGRMFGGRTPKGRTPKEPTGRDPGAGVNAGTEHQQTQRGRHWVGLHTLATVRFTYRGSAINQPCVVAVHLRSLPMPVSNRKRPVSSAISAVASC